MARSAPSASRVTRASTSPASRTETAPEPSSRSRRIAVAAQQVRGPLVADEGLVDGTGDVARRGFGESDLLVREPVGRRIVEHQRSHRPPGRDRGARPAPSRRRATAPTAPGAAGSRHPGRPPPCRTAARPRRAGEEGPRGCASRRSRRTRRRRRARRAPRGGFPEGDRSSPRRTPGPGRHALADHGEHRVDLAGGPGSLRQLQQELGLPPPALGLVPACEAAHPGRQQGKQRVELGTGGRRGGLDRDHAHGRPASSGSNRTEAMPISAASSAGMRSSSCASRISIAWDSSSTVQANGSVLDRRLGPRLEQRQLAGRVRRVGRDSLSRGVVEPRDHALRVQCLAHRATEPDNPLSGLVIARSAWIFPR